MLTFNRRMLLWFLPAIAVLAGPIRTVPGLTQTNPLPSWNDGPAKASITDFVARVTSQGGADFVPAEQRVAVFDNDGTLWCEQPMRSST